MRDWALGFALIGIGVLGLYGSVTGTLASMLAALFDPSDLDVPGGSGGGITLGDVLGPVGAGIFGKTKIPGT